MFLRRKRRTEESGPYWRQRSWQMSAGFLTLLVLMSGIVALTSSRSDGTTAGAKPSRGPLSGAAALENGRPKGCATDDSAGSALPSAAPKDISWRALGVARVPVSASAGPTRFNGSVWWCFAHTPTGAALAATVIPSQMSEPGWRAVTEQQLVAGTGRDMFVFQRRMVSDTARSTDGSVSLYSGFTVVSYTSEAAAVALLIKSGNGLRTTTINLRWSGGDWKLVPGNDGSLYSELTTVQSANRYLLWGGPTT